MNVHFWGVRGSIPTPLSAQQVRAKLFSALQRIKPEDIQSDKSKQAFIDSLPEWISGTTGGNTPCVELTGNNSEKIIFDAGTGIRVMGKIGNIPEDFHYNLFMSHFHWDHIQGLPFFDQAYNPNASFDVYSPFDNMKEYFSKQMISPYYPVTFEAFTKNFRFHVIEPGKTLEIGKLQIDCIKMSHPGTSYSYAVTEGNKKFVYATDVELNSKDFVNTVERSLIFENADALVLDSQYTVEEALRKENWGHSAFCYAIDFAIAWKVKKLYLFHHEPTYDDRKLNTIFESAKWYANYASGSNLEIYLAQEGMEIDL
ncbi:MBL fold metallo-hydrolase [Treponema sp.]|uniref:MBL fold metallo-hydrolase n=1 Tax=Treponema sp. TaxID=166 RepID=UPI00388F6F85